MYRIIDGRATGKTSRLMLLAKDTNSVIACANPYAFEQKAKALKNLYKETNSEDATEIGVKYIKELLNDENATPELKKSF